MSKLCIFIAMCFFATKIDAQESIVTHLSLQDVFNIADKQSHTLRNSRYNVERAKKELDALKLQWTPDVSVSISAGYLGNTSLMDRGFSNREIMPVPHFSNTMEIQLTQPIYDGSILKDIKKQQTATDLAYIQQDIQIQNIHFMLVEWYLYYLKLANLKEVFLKNKVRQERLLVEIQERYTQGTALKSDVTNYRLKLKDTELLLAKNENQINIVNYRFVKLLNLPEHTIIIFDDTFLSKDEKHLKTDIIQAIESTPVFQENLKLYEFSQRVVDALKAKRLPKLFIWGEDAVKGPVSSVMPAINKNIHTWGFGVGLCFNISNWYKSGKSIQAASYSSRMYLEQTELMQDKLATEVYTARSELEESLKELSIRNEYKELASELYSVLYERYSNGMAIVTEMLDAENELVSADIEYLNKLIETCRYYYVLKQIAGTL